MARGRLISKSLSTSAKFAALQTSHPDLAEFCQVLYMLLVAHSDDWGRQSGDVFTIKHVIVPASARTMAEVEAAIIALHNGGMVTWYDTDGRKVIQINDFETHQPGLHKRTDTKSKFLPPTGNEPQIQEVPDTRGNFPQGAGSSSLREENLTEGKGREENRTPALKRVERVSSNPDGFDAFWSAYPKRKSKQDAIKAWRKLSPSPDTQQQILAALAWQRQSPDWLKDGGQFIPGAEKYLNGRRWEDEPTRVPLAGQLSDAGMQSLVGLSAFRERMAAKAAGGGQ